MRTLLVAALVTGAVVLVGCSKDDPLTLAEARAEVEALCTEAGETIAAAPAPADDASREEFRTRFDEGKRPVGYGTREIVEKMETADPDLREIGRTVEELPELIGAWTIEEVAWKTRAGLLRIDELAEAADVPECSAETFRLDDWVRYSEDLNGDGDPAEEFTSELSTLCAETIGAFRFSTESGDLGAIITAGNAERAINSFDLEVAALRPPPDLVDEFVELLVPMLMLDATPRTPAAADRLDAAVDRLGTALDALIGPDGC